MNNLQEAVKDLDIILLMKFGSHLYGTDNENSDTDYKGIFMPSTEDIFLGKIPKSIRRDTNPGNAKNTSEDIDIELYSLHYFIELACKGETAALDMLHVNEPNLIQGSAIWESLVENRARFLTRNLKSFVGYARRQAAKYGMKGSRIHEAEVFLNYLKLVPRKDWGVMRLINIWSRLPIGEHSRFIEDAPSGIKQYQLCGKILQSTITVEMANNIISGFLATYGTRAKEAAENKGIDWKAISHALRAAYQTKEILIEGKITYPLKQATILREIKEGYLDFTTVVLPELERLMEEVEELTKVSQLPETVDRKYWKHFLIDSVSQTICEDWLQE